MKDEIWVPDCGINIYIEPGMMFGSGSHEITQLCARVMVIFKDLYKENNNLIIKSCIDFGCGSGILGTSALKLGLVHATFIDIDANAIRISQENVLANGLFRDQMNFVVGDAKTIFTWKVNHLLMANILCDMLVENADLLINSVRSGGLLCVNGILRDEKLKVASVFSQFTKKRWESVLESLIDDGDWSVLAYFRI
jgi:ribosomal protein L11 methyltransferase